MSLSKRVFVIISLILFLIIIFLVTKIYEKKVTSLKTIEIVNNYKPLKIALVLNLKIVKDMLGIMKKIMH